jgi:hypothetical protein
MCAGIVALMLCPIIIKKNKITPIVENDKSITINNVGKKISIEPNHTKQQMSDSNKIALDQMYGRRGGVTVDDKMTKHRQRIGDRDHKATVAQIKGRRNNSMEPYYRQELEHHGSKRWWDPDTVLMHKATKKQKETIMIGPDAYLPN